MYTDSDQEAGEQPQNNDPLPDGTKIVSYERADETLAVVVSGSEDWLGRADWDGIDIDPQSSGSGGVATDTVHFEEGDSIPLEVARDRWKRRKGDFIARDGNHSVLSCGYNVALEDDPVHGGAVGAGGVLPKGTVRVEVSHKEVNYSISDQLDTDDSWLNASEFEHKAPEAPAGSRNRDWFHGQVRFEEGERVPLEVARHVWETNGSERLLCLDENGGELNDPRTDPSGSTGLPGGMAGGI